MRNVIRWAALAAVCMTFCSCAGLSGAEVATVAVTGAGALSGLIQSLAPMLSIEQQAALSATAANVESTVAATTTAVGQIAQAIAELRAQQQAIESGEMSGGEVAAVGTGLTGVAVAASRLMSRLKHGPSSPPT